MEGEAASGRLVWQERLKQSAVTCAYSAAVAAAAGDLRPLGTSPYPGWPSLVPPCLIRNQALCPGGGHPHPQGGPSHPGTQSPSSSLPGLPKSHPPSPPPLEEEWAFQLSLLTPRSTLLTPNSPHHAACWGSHCSPYLPVSLRFRHSAFSSCFRSEDPPPLWIPLEPLSRAPACRGPVKVSCSKKPFSPSQKRHPYTENPRVPFWGFLGQLVGGRRGSGYHSLDEGEAWVGTPVIAGPQ